MEGKQMDDVPTWGISLQNQTSGVLLWVDPYRHLLTELFHLALVTSICELDRVIDKGHEYRVVAVGQRL